MRHHKATDQVNRTKPPWNGLIAGPCLRARVPLIPMSQSHNALANRESYELSLGRS